VVLVLCSMLGSAPRGPAGGGIDPGVDARAFAAMTLLRVPGNLMSLGALDFGLLVDGAVVMVENVFHRHAATASA
jgi:cobalt-zinc-cadmium resistance protein CzcA